MRGIIRTSVCSLALIIQAGISLAQTSDQSNAPDAPPTADPSLPNSSDSGSQYIVGPGDVIQVFVWRNPELSASVPVRPDGKVSTPLVEDMVAVGKTPSQLARDVERVLSAYIRSPQVNIIVTKPVSTFSQIKVIGEVARPQAIAYREGMTVLDAVLAVGGLSQFAAGNRSKVIRTENGKTREIKIKLERLLDKGDMRQNVDMKPGDVLVVPESRF